jgi:hypothetical protein
VPAFPQTAVLDNFNRSNGAIGGSWVDQKSSFSISSNRLAFVGTTAYIEWGATTFGPNQEAFVTLSAITATASELNLMLKTQGATWNTGHIEVNYKPTLSAVFVRTFTAPGTWATPGSVAVSFAAGDRLGARASADGIVQVFKNGTLVGSVSVAAWAHATKGGRIGLSYDVPGTSRFDDFGGGNWSAAAAAMAGAMPTMPENLNAEAEAASPTALEFGAPTPNPFRQELNLHFALPRESAVRIDVLDLQGRIVATLADGVFAAGGHDLAWNGGTASGRVGAGIYFIRMDALRTRLTRRVAVLP